MSKKRKQKQYSERAYIVSGHLMHILAVITFIILAIPLYTMGIIGGIIFTIISVFEWMLGTLFLKIGKEPEKKRKNILSSTKMEVETNPSISDAEIKEQLNITPFAEDKKIEIIGKINNTNETPRNSDTGSQVPKGEKIHEASYEVINNMISKGEKEDKKITIKVVGLKYRKDNVTSLLTENFFYSETKKDLFDVGLTEERIYKYDYFSDMAELVPEPGNPHDKNAIKVLISGIHIGYIASESAENVLSLIEQNQIRHAMCDIYGGDYKILVLSDDFMYDREEKSKDYILEKHHLDFCASLTIALK